MREPLTFVRPVQNFLNKIKLPDTRFNAQRRIQRGGQRETLLKSLFALLFAKLLCHVSHSDSFLNFVSGVMLETYKAA